MRPESEGQPATKRHPAALRVALIYAAFGVLWILSSDQILQALRPDPAAMTWLQTFKGWAFIGVTAVLVYYLVQRHVAALHLTNDLMSKSEERYRTIVETSNDGIGVFDGNGHLVLVNGRLAELLGQPADELLGRPLVSFLGGPGAAAVRQAIASRHFATATHHGICIRRPDGSERWVVGSLCALPDGQKPRPSGLAIFTDISERRSLERELHQSQKMEAVGQLAGGVAHDFNNLLTAIFGYADLARDVLPEEHPALTSLAGVTAAADQAAGVTKALLTFSRRMPVVKQPVNLNAVVDTSVRLLQRILPATVEVATELTAGQVMVNADATQLQQIIMNLAINARDAMPDGGSLRISTRRGPQKLEAPRGGRPAKGPAWVHLVVADTGTGMPSDIQARIFEPFFTTKPMGVGTGLGLSIIHGIVKDHGGSIHVESEPGRGTVFTVVLPPAEMASREASVAPDRPIRGGGELILLAEDNTHVRELMAAALRACGYEVREVGDGEALLDVFGAEGERVRLILTDLEMPKRDGLSVLAGLRAHGVDLPAILVTGSVEAGVEEALDPNTILVRKPFQMSFLTGLVGQCLNRSA